MSLATPTTSGTMGIRDVVASAVVGPLTTGTRQPNQFIRDYFPVVNQNTKPSAYGGASYDHYDLPKAMEDNVELLMTTLEGILLGQNEFWQTGLMCPYVKKNTDKFMIKKRVLEPAIMKNIPHEGVPELMEWSETQIWIELERIGLAFRFEHEYRLTAEGQIKYMEGIIGFSKFFQEKVNHRVVNAMMNAAPMDVYYRDPTNPGPFDFEAIMEMEVRNFAGLQNPDEGWRYLPNLYNQYRSAMIGAENGAAPDLLVIPANLRSAYTTGGHPEILKFNIQGQNGINLLIKGPEAISFTDGVRIVETPDYSARHNGPAMRLMSRNTIVSQVIPQRSEHVMRCMARDYRSADRAVGVYNMTNDKVDWIDFKDSAKNCGIWDESGTGYHQDTLEFISRHCNKWIYAKNDQRDYCKSKDRVLNMHPDAVPHMFASCVSLGNTSEYKPATHFGMLEEHVLHKQHLHFMAETAFNVFCEGDERRAMAYRDNLRELYELVDEIENAEPPNAAAITTTSTTTTATIGTVNSISEFETYANNATSLSGFNSGPGLYALSRATTNKTFPAQVKKAQNVVKFLRDVGVFVKNVLPKNEFGDFKNVESFWTDAKIGKPEQLLSLVYGLFCMKRPNVFAGNTGSKEKTDISDNSAIRNVIDSIVKCGGDKQELETIVEYYVNAPSQKPENPTQQIYDILNYIAYEYCSKATKDNQAEIRKSVETIVHNLYSWITAKKRDTKTITAHRDAVKFIELALKAPSIPLPSGATQTAPSNDWPKTKTLLAYTPKMSDPRYGLYPGNPATRYNTPDDTDYSKTADEYELIATTQDSMRTPHMRRLEDTSFAKARIPEIAFVQAHSDDAPRDSRFGKVIKSSVEFGDMFGETSGTTSKKLASSPFTHPLEWIGHTDFLRPHFVERWHESNQVPDSMIGAFMKLMLTTRVDDLDQINLLVDSDIYVPIDFYLWQPFAEFIMSSMCLAVAGLPTGATYWGKAAVSRASDGITRLGTVFFTAYENPVIYEPKNVRPIFDVKSEKYLGGLNTTFITRDEEIANFNTEDANIHRPSLIATAIPVTEPDMPRTLNLMGRLNVPSMAHREKYRNTYSTSAFTLARFPSLASVIAIDLGQRTFDGSSQAVTLNTRRARHWVRSSKTGQVDCIRGNGHLDFATYVGAATVCDGGAYHKHRTNHM